MSASPNESTPLGPVIYPVAPAILEQHSSLAANISVYAVPPSWKLEIVDTSQHENSPRRARGTVSFTEAESFITYVKKHTNEQTTLWAATDNEDVTYIAVFNDHIPDSPGWRDLKATYRPAISTEFKPWLARHKKSLDQVGFAQFLRENLSAITAEYDGERYGSTAPLPNAADLFNMSRQLVIKKEAVFSGTYYQENGTVAIQFQDGPDATSKQTMEAFEQFAIKVPVYEGGEPVTLLARLDYNISQSKGITFEFSFAELPQKIKQTQTLLSSKISIETGNPVLNGDPNV